MDTDGDALAGPSGRDSHSIKSSSSKSPSLLSLPASPRTRLVARGPKTGASGGKGDLGYYLDGYSSRNARKAARDDDDDDDNDDEVDIRGMGRGLGESLFGTPLGRVEADTRSLHSIDSKASSPQSEILDGSSSMEFKRSPQGLTQALVQEEGEAGSIVSLGSQPSQSSLGLGSREGGADIWPSAPPLFNVGARAPRDLGDARERARQKELKEWSQPCWMWRVDKSSNGLFSKAPIIREVPAAMKRKVTKRESSQLLSPAEQISSGSFANQAPESSKRSSPVVGRKEGSWKKVIAVLRDDGYLRIFNDEKIILHSIHLPSSHRADIRLVDNSLFGRPNVIAVHRHHSNAPTTPGTYARHSVAGALKTPSTGVFNPSSLIANATSSSSSRREPARDEPVYLYMPSIVARDSWVVMAYSFAQPSDMLVFDATPMSRRVRSEGASGTEDEIGDLDDVHADPRSLAQSRIYRGITLTINEARCLGERGTEITRPSPSNFERRPTYYAHPANSSSTSVDKIQPSFETSPAKSSASGASTRILPKLEDEGSASGIDTFCEIVLEDGVVGRTSLRRGTNSPYITESFTFGDLGPLARPLIINVYQAHKITRPTLIGSVNIRVQDLPRSELVQDWWCVKPSTLEPTRGSTDTLGELSIDIRVDEQVLLPLRDYKGLLDLLNNDTDAEIALDLAYESPEKLEEISRLLLRIYQSQDQLEPRLLRLSELEIVGNASSASILFRGNSIFTKCLEFYIRLVGSEYLEASIGPPVRELCLAKVEIEIDPSRMKPGYKEQDIERNLELLKVHSLRIWTAIYDNRAKCPNVVRNIFYHIQRIVVEKYGEDSQRMRSTSVSAFIFLRLFVPAILNPKLFGLVNSPPGRKAQRSLTLVAKTLQGLANFASFGQKESFMKPMGSFVTENMSEGFVDFIDHISKPSLTTQIDWTSTSSSAYVSAHRLRNSLPPNLREGIPLLPHLIDLPRELSLLAAHVVRTNAEKSSLSPSTEAASVGDGGSIASQGRRSARYGEFVEVCLEVHEEAQRRGGGLVMMSAPGLPTLNNDPRRRARAATVRTGRVWTRSPFDVVPSATLNESEFDDFGGKGGDLTPEARTRSHRSFTVNGATTPFRQPLHPTPIPFSFDDVQTPPSPTEPLYDDANQSNPSSTSLGRSNSSVGLDLDPEEPGFLPPRRISTTSSDLPVRIIQETTTTVEHRQLGDAGPEKIVFTSPFGASSGRISITSRPASLAEEESGSVGKFFSKKLATRKNSVVK